MGPLMKEMKQKVMSVMEFFRHEPNRNIVTYGQVHPEYEKLPEALRSTISAEEFTCIPDILRRKVHEDAVYPEILGDD
jgi:hypothetical protein